MRSADPEGYDTGLLPLLRAAVRRCGSCPVSVSLLNQCNENRASPDPSTNAASYTLLTSESNRPWAFPKGVMDKCT